MSLTTQQQINTGRVCAYLAENSLASGRLHGGAQDIRLPSLLYNITEGLEQLYTLDSSHADLTMIGNYLISICKDYAKAQRILALGGGGSVATIVGGLPRPEEFVVSASSSIVTGASSLVIPRFIGYNLLFVRNFIPQSTINLEDGSSYHSWDKTTGTFTCSPAAGVGELFQLIPV